MSVGITTARRRLRRAAHLGPYRRRPQVLDAALAIAEKHGIRQVSMEAVAHALRVTKPVVYACYGSREELVTALLEREEARLLAGVMSALPQALDFRDPQRMFAKGFEALLVVVAEHPSAWQLVVGADPDPGVAHRYGRARKRVAARVAELMRAGLTHAGTTDVERKLPVLVEVFMAVGDAAVRSMASAPGSWTPGELGALVGRVLLGALRSA